MLRNIQTDITADEEPRHSSPSSEQELQATRSVARELAASLGWVPGTKSSDTFSKRCAQLSDTFQKVFSKVDAVFEHMPNSEDLLWLRDNEHQLFSVARSLASELGPMAIVPHVRSKDEVVPRVLAIAEAFFAATDYAFSEKNFQELCVTFEETTPLEFHEIGALVPALKLVVLEQIAARASAFLKDPKSASGQHITTLIRTFRDVIQASWEELLESLVPFDVILRQDPVGAFAAMDTESRSVYRERIARIARHSDRSEMEVAQEALALAQKAHEKRFRDKRIELRECHIGYYLMSDGTRVLWERVGFHPPAGERLRTFLRRHPDEFLLFGIAILTLVIITAAVWLLTPAATSPQFVSAFNVDFVVSQFSGGGSVDELLDHQPDAG